jgi:hypothetical protein
LAKNATYLVDELTRYFDQNELELLARKTKFIQRKSKIRAVEFLSALMFVHQQGKELSLLDICGDLYNQFNKQITKQSLHERFNEKAVAFLKAVLSKLLSQQFKVAKKDKSLCIFNRVRIKDSTRFILPDSYSKKYQGHGGNPGTSGSMISIQYEYDALSEQAMDLRLTCGRRSDHFDSKEHTHDIAKNDLFIRDLGYITLDFLLKIINAGAYFINRINPRTKVYHAEHPGEELDFVKCYKRIKKYKLDYLEYDVVAVHAKVPCRIVLYPVRKAIYESRIRRTKKFAKSKGHKVSDAYKNKVRLAAYITNISRKHIVANKIKTIYRLRWQIELTFKIWKSQAKISQIKEIKMHRFECQLMSKLIWLLIHKRILNYLTRWVNTKHPDKTCSLWKYYKHAYRINHIVRKAIFNPNKLLQLLLNLMDLASTQFLLETKKRKISHYQALLTLA